MDQLEEIKRKIDLVDLIGEAVALKKAGRNFKALCPFHSEAQPSFIVSPERQIWKCFGCSRGGDHFRFLMEMEGMEFGEAVRKLAKRAGVKLRAYRPSEGEQKKRFFWEVNDLAAEFYHFLLTKHQAGKEALEYILGRGISKESIETFKLGFAPKMWDGLGRYLTKKKGYKAADLERASLVIKSARGSFYDRFRGRLMFPLRDHQGNICGFAGRVLEPEAKTAKYVNSSETLVYHKSRLLYGLWLTRVEIKKKDEVVLVEGELDAISSYQTGVKNVAAIKGSALTDEQLDLLKRYTTNLTIALDSDVAGDEAARRGIEIADAQGFSIKVVQVKGGKDPDEVAQKDPEGWQKQVKEAKVIYDYFFEAAFEKEDARTAEGKRKIGRELVPVILKITDKIVQGHYISLLANRLRVDEAAILAEMEKLATRAEEKGVVESALEKTKKGRGEVLEEYLLALCLQTGNWRFLTKRRVAQVIEEPGFKRLIEVLKDYLKKFKTVKSERLGKMLPAELKEIFDRLYLYDLGDWVEKEEQVKEEIERTSRDLEKIGVKKRLQEIGREIKALEGEKGSGEKLRELNREFRDLTAKLGEF